MAEDQSIFEVCFSTHGPDISKDLLECVSKPVDSLISGVDTFYLIFAGALVFFMQIGKQCLVCTHN